MLLPRTTDPMLRAGLWNSLRSGVHVGGVSAEAALAVVAAGLPGERDDDARWAKAAKEGLLPRQ